MSSLSKRVLSAIILMPAFLLSLFINDWLFYIVILLMGGLALWEWYKIVNRDLPKKAINNDTDKFLSQKLMVFGFVYIVIFVLSMTWIFSHVGNGASLILFICAIVWATDIFAYFTGKTIGGPKLAPNISPNKTWAGLMGGMTGATFIASILSLPQFSLIIFDDISTYFVAFIGLILALVDQAGDLLISAIKRKYEVKDTGNIIPGHGGILDRIDGLILATIVFAAILFFIEKGIF